MTIGRAAMPPAPVPAATWAAAGKQAYFTYFAKFGLRFSMKAFLPSTASSVS